MKVVYEPPKSLTEKPFIYCPGCTHGIIHRIIAEVMDELEIREKTIMVSPVGCSVFAYEYFNCDGAQAAHGRAPAVATGIKRSVPGSVVFTYQGDGDLAAIGTAETVHAATRGEKITAIFVNNVVYGMTGGQMAPTTLVGQKATTCINGRDPKVNGYPIRVSELLAQLEGARYLERTAINTPQNIMKTKKAITKAFQNQINGVGFSLVEVLSTCPTNWGMDPVASMQFLATDMMKHYPLGVYKDVNGGK